MKQRRDVIPLLLSATLLLGISLLAFMRHRQGISAWSAFPFDWDLGFAGLYVVWILVEFPVAKKDTRTEGKRTLDFCTCQAYALGQAGTILTALWFPSVWRSPGIWHFVACLLFIGGIAYRLWAIHTLGQFYSHRVRKMEQHRIVDSGPYRIIRHPAYSGMIAAHAGVTLYFFNWLTLAVFLIMLIPSIVLRIFVEEKMLFNIEGYPKFAEKRKRLFPAIW